VWVILRTVTSPPTSPFVVALTGGIASGKTAVSDRFAALGVPVIDTDVIAHQVVEPGQPALQEIVRQFGNGILLPDGNLDRRAMRQKIFSDTTAKKRLESILHPAIRSRVQHQIAAVTAAYCVVVIPLFTETGSYDWVDRVLVVDVDEETQVQRVMQRDGVSREQALDALAAQASRASRLALADDVIVNDGSFNDLVGKVNSLHAEYTRLSAGRR
jgi:dephospho-CoA kinase